MASSSSSSSLPNSSSSTAVLHSSANVRKETLLSKLGGKQALHTAVDKFYDRLVEDPSLQEFFVGFDLKMLKWHQFNFMSIAFASVPADFDVVQLILSKHERLFEQGMEVQHFDTVCQHFVTVLKEMSIDPMVIDEAMKEHVLPLRPVFDRGAKEAIQRSQARKARRRVTNITLFTTAVAVGLCYYYFSYCTATASTTVGPTSSTKTRR